MYDANLDYAKFSPSTMSIIVDIDRLKSDYPNRWKIEIIALFVHEMVHLLDWVFVYRFDAEKWNDNEDKQESKANKWQDRAYHLLNTLEYREKKG